ncbi:acyl-CoA dehydrogenase family protein [Streptomyces sp. NPDC048057]|uniref:acyl-CoA dehydrogenase family protein n=1 Tax=Streptomyces sp. NPDC048057 TaxID=3155628 RepID=UPI00340E708D
MSDAVPTSDPVPAAPPPHEGDLRYSQAEDDLRAAVRAVLADHVGPDGTAPLLARAEAGRPYDPDLWRTLAVDVGAAGLLVPEEFGGAGAGHREAAVVLEELGRAVTPAPYLTGCVMATEALLTLDTGRSVVAELLAAVASGRTTAVLAVPFAASPWTPPAPLHGPDGCVSGVADVAAATALLVHRTDGLYAVDTADAHRSALTPLDLTRPLAVVAPGTGGRLIAGPAEAAEAVRRGLLAGAGLLASEQVGVAEWCLEQAVRHTRERHQFNRPVGSFQALKHRMAELWLTVVSARAAARNAADALATASPDAPVAVAVAQAYASDAAVHAAEECVQLHAGIGMTWEHPVHLYLKRAKSAQLALGSPGAHRDALAALVDLPAP